MLFVMHFFETRRKDFWEMLTHHVITISLIAISFTSNFHRSGSVILVIINFTIIFLEASKSLKYAKLHKACYTSFIIFAMFWFISRLIIFPYLVYVEITLAREIFPIRLILDLLLICLAILNWYWTYLISVMIIRLIRSKALEKDERSSSEYNSSPDEQVHANGNGSKKM